MKGTISGFRRQRKAQNRQRYGEGNRHCALRRLAVLHYHRRANRTGGSVGRNEDVDPHNAALARTGVGARGASHYQAMFHATASTDRLIELILKKDEDVLKELLTTQQVVATGNDKTYFGKKNNKEEREVATLARKKEAEARLAKEAAESITRTAYFNASLPKSV